MFQIFLSFLLDPISLMIIDIIILQGVVEQWRYNLGIIGKVSIIYFCNLLLSAIGKHQYAAAGL